MRYPHHDDRPTTAPSSSTCGSYLRSRGRSFSWYYQRGLLPRWFLTLAAKCLLVAECVGGPTGAYCSGALKSTGGALGFTARAGSALTANIAAISAATDITKSKRLNMSDLLLLRGSRLRHWIPSPPGDQIEDEVLSLFLLSSTLINASK
jgi:hypothetical protein